MDKLRLKRILTARYRGIKGLIELRIYGPNGPQVWFFSYKNINALVNVIYNLSQSKEYEIYLGIHSRWRRESWNNRTKELTALVLEIDCFDYSENDGVKLMKKINSFPLEPSIRINLGNCMYWYWQFKKPILKSSTPNYQEYVKGLANQLGCNGVTNNYEKVVRLPYVAIPKPGSKSDYPFKEGCQMNKKGNGQLLRYDLKDFDFVLS